MKRIRIFLEYLFAFILVSALLLAIISTIAVKFYGDDLQSRVTRSINSKIDTKVYAEQVSISILRKFPYTSVVLKNVTIWSSHNFNEKEFGELSTDTLLNAEAVYLNFNILDLLRKKYSIRQLEIRNGSLRILSDSKGEGNYRFLKSPSEEQEKDGLFVLKDLDVLNFEYILDDHKRNLAVSGIIHELRLNGNFYRKDFQLKTQADLEIGQFMHNETVYAEKQDLRARIHLDVHDTLVRITKGSIQYNTLAAESSGELIRHGNGTVTTDISFETKDLDLKSLTGIIPGSLNKKGWIGTGRCDLSAGITGVLSSDRTPNINADFTARNVGLTAAGFPFEVTELNLRGHFTNGRACNAATTSLNISEFSAEIGKEVLSGNGSFSNFSSPFFRFRLDGIIDPSYWVGLYDQPLIDKAEGKIRPDLEVRGTMKRKGKGPLAPEEILVSGDLMFSDIELHFKNNPVPLEALSGTITIQDRMWEPSLKGRYGKSDFQINGSGLNLISYLLGQKNPLIVSADFSAKQIDLQEILNSLPLKPEKGESGVLFPENLNIRLHCNINDFEKDRFKARDLAATLRYDSPLLIIDSLSMQTMDGSLSGNMALAQDNKGMIYTNVTADLQKLNIQELFYAFNNFGQKQLTDRNLKGTISGHSEFAAAFSDHFKINTTSIINQNDIEIIRGELNNFEPILALSRFIDIRELENIHFETLHNTILIRENRVIIPEMNIRSNALDLSGSGIHRFDKSYEYRIRLLLSELLYQKARKNDDTEYAGTDDPSDTRTLFLKIYNNGKENKVEYDREQASEKIRDDLKQEKAELKQLLNEELGLFRKEETSTGRSEPAKREGSLFRFEFDEENPEPDTI
ncbi:MAG: AsmA family protein, partial [Bacteroidales bacterium]|nr:AsmA family protein [Bacteroidales bacterium]